MKIVIIPAAMKKVDNPYHNIRYPESVNQLMNRKKNEQKSLNNFFTHLKKVNKITLVENEFEKLNIDSNGGNFNDFNNNNNIENVFS